MASTWTRPNVGRAFSRLGKAAWSVVGLIEAATAAVITFLISLIPGSSQWFTGTIFIFSAVGIFAVLLAFSVALAASAEIEVYRVAEAKRNSTFQDQYRFLMANLRDLMDEVRSIERGDLCHPLSIMQRWDGWEYVHSILDDINTFTATLRDTSTKDEGRFYLIANDLRNLCDKAMERTEAIYRGTVPERDSAR